MSGPRGDGGHSSPWRGAGVPRDQRLPGACSSSGVTGKRSRHTGLGGCRVGSSAKDRLSCWHTATGWWAVPGGPAKWDWRVAGGPQSIPPLLCHPPGPQPGSSVQLPARSRAPGHPGGSGLAARSSGGDVSMAPEPGNASSWVLCGAGRGEARAEGTSQAGRRLSQRACSPPPFPRTG